MSDYCSKCVEQKRECRCVNCSECEADITENKQLKNIIFKKKKLFCRRCSVPFCGKCHVNMLCSTCHNVQESYNALWREIDFSISPSVSAKEKDFDNALDDMIEAIREQSVSTLQNLIEHCGKSYLYKADAEGQTLLHHAVKTSDVDMIRYMVDQGSNVNHVDNEGCSLLHLLAAADRTPKQSQICDMLVSGGVNTFLLNDKRETALAISLQTENFELQSLLEPTMYRDSSAIILKFLNSQPDLAADVSACLRYIVSKIKCLNPFEKKLTNKVGRQKSLNYRCIKDKGSVMSDGVDPYKLKKTVADNNEKLTSLKEEILSLRDEVVQNTAQHRSEVKRLDGVLSEEKKNKNLATLQLKDYYNNTVCMLEADLQEAKKLEEDAKLALEEVLQLNRRYKLSWVPKSVTLKCADINCRKMFNDGHSQHHCRCCGRVFCYQCAIQRVPIPVYGYDTPVRVCSYCYNLLNEEVLCDFDETDIDIDQWNSVHYQNESNTDNLGKKSFFNFGGARGRTATVTSGYATKSLGGSSGSSSERASKRGDSDSEPGPRTDTDSEGRLEVSAGSGPGLEQCPGNGADAGEDLKRDLSSSSSWSCSVVASRRESTVSDVYSDSESTLSNKSEHDTDQSSILSDGSQWKENIKMSFSIPGQKLQNLFRNNSLKRINFSKK